MGAPRGPRDPFPKVKEAREALQAKALELMELHEEAIRRAMDSDKFDIALAAIQWAIEHIPADEAGLKVLETSIDKQAVEKGGGAPTIQIGIALTPKALPAPTVNVIDLEANESE